MRKEEDKKRKRIGEKIKDLELRTSDVHGPDMAPHFGGLKTVPGLQNQNLSDGASRGTSSMTLLLPY